ncbi:hypothetical protein EV184_118109 [Sinorhizobium americanum]|uniref:Helix-turn-helix domain-containing protein n=1 Tax=Sinorhizobium americanum TaxID=194963 RepID=A0A4R2BH55_9HYPH|nr:hypothetical protein EV184_118109 [Sinorhizobium americanum]
MTEVRENANGGQKVAFTIEEFCRAYAVGRSLAYKEIASGRLRTRKAGRRTLILSADANAWANALPEGRCA